MKVHESRGTASMNRHMRTENVVLWRRPHAGKRERERETNDFQMRGGLDLGQKVGGHNGKERERNRANERESERGRAMVK